MVHGKWNDITAFCWFLQPSGCSTFWADKNLSWFVWVSNKPGKSQNSKRCWWNTRDWCGYNQLTCLVCLTFIIARTNFRFYRIIDQGLGITWYNQLHTRTIISQLHMNCGQNYILPAMDIKCMVTLSLVQVLEVPVTYGDPLSVPDFGSTWTNSRCHVHPGRYSVPLLHLVNEPPWELASLPTNSKLGAACPATCLGSSPAFTAFSSEQWRCTSIITSEGTPAWAYPRINHSFGTLLTLINYYQLLLITINYYYITII